jgi:hypothetical protein
MGRYDVAIDTGPSYHTQRQEAAEAMTELATKYPPLMQVAGDLVMRTYDFPMAQELADRLAKTLPPGLKDDEGQQQIPPEVQAAMQQMKDQIDHMHESGAILQKENEQLKSEREIDLKKLVIEAYAKETDRLKVVAPAMPADAVQAIVRRRSNADAAAFNPASLRATRSAADAAATTRTAAFGRFFFGRTA